MTSSEFATCGHSGHASNLGLMSCVRESSPQECLVQPEENPNRNETSKKRRFHPFRGLRKIFRKKLRYSSEDEVQSEVAVQEPIETGQSVSATATGRDPYKSRSTSELLSEDDSPNASVSNIYPGLSISHDSVFTGEKYPSQTNLDSGITQSSSSLSIQQHTNIKLELANVLRQRRDKKIATDEEDLGLPSSICDSPTAAHQTSHKTKSHSTCSDGSLLSIGSSEIDEGSFHYSSFENKFSVQDEFGVQDMGNFPLNHNAAKHKMAVKPKRTHGAPRRPKKNQLVTSRNLPVTLEEDIFSDKIINFTSEPNIIEDSNESGFLSNKLQEDSGKEKISKSASLPPGLTLPGKNILSRSCSNASSKKSSNNTDDEKDKPEKPKKESESFFGRFLIRRSNKKLSKKSKTEDQTISIFKEEKIEEKKFKTSISVDHIEIKKMKNDEQITSIKINPPLHNLTISIDENDAEVNKLEEYISLNDQEIELKNSVEKQKEIFEKTKILHEKKLYLKSQESNDKKAPDSPEKSLDNQYLFDQKIVINDEKHKITKQIKKMKSDDYFLLNSTKVTLSEDTRKNSMDTSLKNMEPRSGPATRQRVQPIDIPPSPDLKIGKRPQTIENSTKYKSLPMLSFNDLVQNSSDQEKTSSSAPCNHQFFQFRHSPLTSPTKVVQNWPIFNKKDTLAYKSKSYDETDNDFKSLSNLYDDISKPYVPKSYSFRSKLTPKKEPKPPTDTIETKNNVVMLNLNKGEPKDSNVTTNENTTIVSIQNDNDFSQKVGPDTPKPKPNVRKSIETPTKDKVPEFLKIQLNKVSKVQNNNVILTTDGESKAKLESNEPNVSVKCHENVTVKENVSVNVQNVTIRENTKENVSKTENISVKNQENVSVKSQDGVKNQNATVKNQENVKNQNVTLKSQENVETQSVKTQENVKNQNVTLKSQENVKTQSVKSQDNDKTQSVTVKTQENVKSHENVKTQNVTVKTQENVKSQGVTIKTKENVKIQSTKSQENIKNVVKTENVIVKTHNVKSQDNISTSTVKVQENVNVRPQSVTVNVKESVTKSQNIKNTEKEIAKEESREPFSILKTSSGSSLSDMEKPENKNEENFDVVVLRRKNSAFSTKTHKDSEEPELMKVFARRSLKLKDSEAESLSQHVIVLMENSQIDNTTDSMNRVNLLKSSDKENEENDVPLIKTYSVNMEPSINEIKTSNKPEIITQTSISKKKIDILNKFERSSTYENNQKNIQDDTRKSVKSFISKSVINNDSILNNQNNKKCDVTLINLKSQNDVINTSIKNDTKNEESESEYSSMFKRISQRKEEWEQRAQQALNKKIP